MRDRERRNGGKEEEVHSKSRLSVYLLPFMSLLRNTGRGRVTVP